MTDYGKLHAVKGAYEYAKAEKSDPFALARALAHVRQGCAGPGDYDAEETTETRAIDNGRGGIEEYQAVVYKNVKRA